MVCVRIVQSSSPTEVACETAGAHSFTELILGKVPCYVVVEITYKWQVVDRDSDGIGSF